MGIIKRFRLEGINGGPAVDAKPFPHNNKGLDNGTTLAATSDMPWFGINVGQQFGIFWDGEFIRAGGLSWSIDGLSKEIDAGYWEIIKAG